MIGRYALRSLLRNKMRTTVTLLGVASLLLLVTVLATFLNGLYNTPESEAAKVRLIARHQVSLTFPLPESYWEEIRTMPHVVEAAPMSWFGGRYRDEDVFFARFFVDPDSWLRIATEITADPGEVAAWKEDQAGAIASRKLAERLEWKIGDRIPIVGDIYPLTAELTLRALYDGGDDALYFHRDYVTEALGGEYRGVGTYAILVDSLEARARVAEAVDARYADSEAPTKTETENEFQAGFVEMMGNVKGLMARIMTAIAVTIVITAGNTMAMAVRERTTELAILKAVGFSPARIVGLVVTESVALASFAALLGIGGFAFLTWLVFRVARVEVPGLWFVPVLPASTLALLIGAAVMLGALAGLVPALMAARLPVVTGLRRN